MKAVLFRLGLLILLVAMAALAPALKNDNGLVIIRFGDYLYETSLVFFVLVLIALAIAASIAVRLAFLPSRAARRFTHNRRERNLYRGLLALQQGNWRSAENNLTHSAGTDAPAIVYLAAAQAAHAQSADARGEDYLRLASKQPQGEFAADLVRAQWLLDQKKYLTAIDLLQELAGRKRGNNIQVLNLLLQACRKIGDWGTLLNHSRDLEKSGIVDAIGISQIRLAAHKETFASQKDIASLIAVWQDLPRPDRKNPEIIAAYCQHSLDLGEDKALQSILESALKKSWQPELVDFYSKIDTGKTKSRLVKAEKWHKIYPEDPVLLRTLGRLCLQEGLLAKAQEYYLESIRLGPESRTFEELGNFAEKFNARDAAVVYFQNALHLNSGMPLNTAPDWHPGVEPKKLERWSTPESARDSQ